MFTTNDLLIVIDMQNDFIDGALGTKEAAAIVDAVAAAASSIRSTPTATTISRLRKVTICQWSTASRAATAGP